MEDGLGECRAVRVCQRGVFPMDSGPLCPTGTCWACFWGAWGFLGDLVVGLRVLECRWWWEIGPRGCLCPHMVMTSLQAKCEDSPHELYLITFNALIDPTPC